MVACQESMNIVIEQTGGVPWLKVGGYPFGVLPTQKNDTLLTCPKYLTHETADLNFFVTDNLNNQLKTVDT